MPTIATGTFFFFFTTIIIITIPFVFTANSYLLIRDVHIVRVCVHIYNVSASFIQIKLVTGKPKVRFPLGFLPSCFCASHVNLPPSSFFVHTWRSLRARSVSLRNSTVNHPLFSDTHHPRHRHFSTWATAKRTVCTSETIFSPVIPALRLSLFFLRVTTAVPFVRASTT